MSGSFSVLPHHIDETRVNDIAYIAVALGILIILPQIIKIYGTQSAGDIASFSWVGSVGISLIWLYYGINEKLKPIIISSFVHLGLSGIVLYGILLYGSLELFDFLNYV